MYQKHRPTRCTKCRPCNRQHLDIARHACAAAAAASGLVLYRHGPGGENCGNGSRTCCVHYKMIGSYNQMLERTVNVYALTRCPYLWAPSRRGRPRYSGSACRHHASLLPLRCANWSVTHDWVRCRLATCRRNCSNLVGLLHSVHQLARSLKLCARNGPPDEQTTQSRNESADNRCKAATRTAVQHGELV